MAVLKTAEHIVFNDVLTDFKKREDSHFDGVFTVFVRDAAHLFIIYEYVLR